ncbi:calcium-binding protein [Lentilitoribacter sp. EG35]|uniref:calcium-binding protein n=1 Tax=Lentilitoribacter sp. EG35 TaxID=3234192 RepID=UPI00345F8D1A
MAKLKLNSKNLNATDLNALSGLEGGPLGTSPYKGSASLTIAVSPESFSYVVSAPRGGTRIEGTGENLIFDAQNRPIGGTIFTISGSDYDIGAGTSTNRSYEITDISIDASEVLSGTFGTAVFQGNDEVEIILDGKSGTVGSGLPSSSSSVSASGGDDYIKLDSIPNYREIEFGSINIDSGAGSDTIELATNLPRQKVVNVTTGEGKDSIIINFDPVNASPRAITEIDNVAVQFIKDFDINNDSITLPPLSPNDSWKWQVIDVDGSAEIRAQKLDINGLASGEIGTRIIVEGVTANQLDLIDTPPPTPTGPVFGTDDPDALTGDATDNIFVGLGGDDAIIGLAGNDVLIGGDGNDSLDAGDGNDQLFGEFGDDTLFGGAGDDALFGGLGNDFLVGDADGTSGVDGIFGGEGNDVAFGGLGADYIEGGADDDSLFGETGADVILGGTGNDFIDGGTENDVISGGEGNDILLGGLGDDEIRGDDGDDSILGQEGNDTIFGGFGVDTIDGGDGNDNIFGETGADTVFGGLGNDTIYGNSGDDNIFGGEGDDSLFGNTENDTIFAGAGNDSLAGGTGNDVLFGEDGNDTFTAGSGIDVINGGAGIDTLTIGPEDGQIFWQDFENGTDRISFGLGVNKDNFSSKVTIASTTDGNSTLITYDNTQLFLENVDASLIDEEDFNLRDMPEPDVFV